MRRLIVPQRRLSERPLQELLRRIRHPQYGCLVGNKRGVEGMGEVVQIPGVFRRERPSTTTTIVG